MIINRMLKGRSDIVKDSGKGIYLKKTSSITPIRVFREIRFLL